MTELIAEIGQNHNGDMGLARELIHAARDAGADVAKFQLFDARRLFSREGNPWYEYNLKTELSRGQVEELCAVCAGAGIEFMASVFDAERVGWLEALGVRRYKVASRSIADAPLLTALGRTGKPLLVSLGHWAGEAFPLIPTAARVDFLYCVARYPAPLESLKLASVDFTAYAGFSDHSEGIAAAVAAYARGARIVEKHLTMDRAMHGPDHQGSATPRDMAAINAWRKDIAMLL
ncbi:MAG: N-acetylneuraminate synthase family protein [Humidesulfovibrio sp.]